MKELRHTAFKNCGIIIQGTCLLLSSLVIMSLGGCSIWKANLDPNYKSSRADRLCHPYGECSQGTWVADGSATQDATVANAKCHEVVAARYGNGEWEDSVAKGLEIGRCMEKKGYRLQQ